MAHVLVAWELGGNLGHLMRLWPIAQRLMAKGLSVSWAVRDLPGTRAMLGADTVRGRLFQAPLMVNAPPRATWTMADVMQLCGYASQRTLVALTEAWLTLIETSRCDVVLADHSPTALLAARVAGVRALHIGNGFTVPPQVSPLPKFRDWGEVDPDHVARSEAHVLANVNAVLGEHGVAPLSQLCDLFYPAQTFLCSWPELDHYRGVGRRSSDFCGPDGEYVPGVQLAWPEGEGSRVMVYLRRSHPSTVSVLTALAQVGVPALCYLPGEGDAPVRAPNLRHSPQPLDMRHTLPNASLVICHAGPATVTQGLRLGIPALMLPEHAEQHLFASQVERCGAGVNLAMHPPTTNLAQLVVAMLQPGNAYTRAAQVLADKHRGHDPAVLSDRIAAAVLG